MATLKEIIIIINKHQYAQQFASYYHNSTQYENAVLLNQGLN